MLTIKAEAIAGASIENTFDDAAKLANKTGCYVEFNFNDILCCAHPNGNSLIGVENYNREVRKKDGFKYATNFKI